MPAEISNVVRCKMNKKEIEYWAKKFESELKTAIADGNPHFTPFLGYFGEALELAKNGNVERPVVINITGAYRHWFSETDLPEYPEVEKAFVKLVYYLKDGENDPSEQKRIMFMEKIKSKKRDLK